MLSKIIISITILFAVRFISSQRLEVRTCFTDDEFLAAAQFFKFKSPVAVIITDNPESNEVLELMTSLMIFEFYDFITVNVTKDKCPITMMYLFSGNFYPTIFVIRQDYLNENSWNKSGSTRDLVDYIKLVTTSPQRTGPDVRTVTEYMAGQISKRNMVTLRQTAGQPQIRHPSNWFLFAMPANSNPQSEPSVTGPGRRSSSPPEVESKPTQQTEKKSRSPSSVESWPSQLSARKPRSKASVESWPAQLKSRLSYSQEESLTTKQKGKRVAVEQDQSRHWHKSKIQLEPQQTQSNQLQRRNRETTLRIRVPNLNDSPKSTSS